MKKDALALVLALSAVACHAFTLGPGETLKWDNVTLAADEEIVANGGAIVFDSDTVVRNVIRLGGEVEVAVNNAASVRFTKTLFRTSPTGRLVLPSSVRFGSDDSAKFAFLPENSIAFTATANGAKLHLAGYASMLVLPDKWTSAIPYVCEEGALLGFYGSCMVTDADYTVPQGLSVRIISPTNFAEKTVINVPTSSMLQIRPSTFNFETCSPSTINNGTKTVCSNDIVLAGGMLRIMNGATHEFFGSVSGTGEINISNTAWPNADRNVYTYFYGGVDAMDAQSVLSIDQYATGGYSLNNGCRLGSDFAGTVRMRFVDSKNDIVSFGFSVPDGSGKTNESWSVGAIEGGNLIGPRNGDGGARLQFSANQHIHVGTLSGKLAVFASSAKNTCDLTVGTVADNTEIYVKNGLRMHLGTVGKNVKIRYMADQVSSNVLEVASGMVEEIEFLADDGKPVYLSGGVKTVAGPGKVIARDGSRVGFVASGAMLEVSGGTVTMDDGGLFGNLPALWFDASDISTYSPLFKEGYHSKLGHQPSLLLGADRPANVYTNNFPLVEKWYDKRDSQKLNFFWNNRWQDADSFYPQFYPFIVPGGLNGKSYLSFGISRDSGLSGEWTHKEDKNDWFGTEHRRMHLMQSETEGHAVYVASCIMVFGSSRGGGRCLLGGYKGYTQGGLGMSDYGGINPPCGDHFLRGGTGYGAGNSIFNSDRPHKTWVNGVDVDSTADGMSGGWDVISFNTDNGSRAFRNIGSPDDVNKAGGQDYAEILVYTNVLTDTQRRLVEARLAAKWGLSAKQAEFSTGSIVLAADGTLEGWWPNVSGSGRLVFSENDDVMLESGFAGTVAGAGNVSAENAPSLDPAFAGTLAVAGAKQRFTYSNGSFSPGLVAPNADLSFPGAVTVTINAGGAKLNSGRHLLVSGKSLQGFANCTLEHDLDSSVKVRLERKENALYLRVFNSTAIIVR